jgi:hypothetical protein
MIDFSSVKFIVIPEGMVTKIVSAGVTLWKTVTEAYKNWVSYAIDTDGSVFNGQGWIAEYRVRSSGALGEATHTAATGYIPVKAGDVIRFCAGDYDRWETASGSNCIHYSDASFGTLGSFTTQPSYYGICSAENSVVSTDENGIKTVTVPDNANIAYMRMSIRGNYSDARHGSDLIVAINEEIT